MSDGIQIVRMEDVPAAVSAILVSLKSLEAKADTFATKSDVDEVKKTASDHSQEIAKFNRILTMGKGGWFVLTGIAGWAAYALGLFDKLRALLPGKMV